MFYDPLASLGGRIQNLSVISIRKFEKSFKINMEGSFQKQSITEERFTTIQFPKVSKLLERNLQDTPSNFIYF